VNGPGEAKDAHVGIAGGRGFGLLFKEGKIIERVEKDKMLSKLMETVHEIVQEEGQV
jgi:(E)-4-hydroxy-3-methylbut-2-enyl-diphosphate synthase